MKQFKLVQVGNPDFRKPCTAYTNKSIITPKTQTLIHRLIYTMRKVHGVGLAGPQIGSQCQVFVMRLRPTTFRPDTAVALPYAVFNPQILSYSPKKETDWEGCFSVAKAGLFAKVDRPTTVKVKYLNHKAEAIERTITGLEARVFQHEYDHLQGQVFLDKNPDPTSFMSAEEYKAMRKRQTKP